MDGILSAFSSAGVLRNAPVGQLATMNELMMAKALRQRGAYARPQIQELMNYPDNWQQLGQNVQASFPTDSPEAVRQAAIQAAMNVGPQSVVPTTWFRGMNGKASGNLESSLRKTISLTDDPLVASEYATGDPARNYASQKAPSGSVVYKVNADTSKVKDLTKYMEGAKKYGVESGITYGDAIRLLEDLGLNKNQATNFLIHNQEIGWSRKYGSSGWDAYAGPVDKVKANTPMVAPASSIFEAVHKEMPNLFSGSSGVLFRGSLSNAKAFDPSKPWVESKTYNELRPLDNGILSNFFSSTGR